MKRRSTKPRRDPGWVAVRNPEPPHILDLIRMSKESEHFECGTWILELERRARSGDTEAMERLRREVPKLWRTLQQELNSRTRRGSNPARSTNKEIRHAPKAKRSKEV
jgi:hypothetical protein